MGVGINQGTSGNVSCRVPGGFLVTASGIPYDTMVLGGRWTKKNIGVAGDRVGGFVRKGGVAQNWCDLSEVKN